MSGIWFLLSLWSAPSMAETPAVPGGGEFVPPRPTRRVPPRYPSYFPVRVEQLNCVFTMRVDATGRVADVDTSRCYGELGAPIGEVFDQWRFEPATLDGEPVPGTFKLKLKLLLGSKHGASLTEEQFRTIYDAHSTLPGDGPGCRAAVTVHADGSLTDLATTRFPRCMVVFYTPEVDAGVFQAQDTVCHAHFTVHKRRYSRPTFEGCDPLARAAIADMAGGWLFTSLGASQMDWDLAVTFAAE